MAAPWTQSGAGIEFAYQRMGKPFGRKPEEFTKSLLNQVASYVKRAGQFNAGSLSTTSSGRRFYRNFATVINKNPKVAGSILQKLKSGGGLESLTPSERGAFVNAVDFGYRDIFRKEVRRKQAGGLFGGILGKIIGFAAPVVGSVIAGPVGGAIAGAVTGGAKGGPLGALLGGLGGFTTSGFLGKLGIPTNIAGAPSLSNLFSKVPSLFGSSSALTRAVNPNAVPGLSTGVTTPAGGGAIVGMGAPGLGAGTAAPLLGVGGVPVSGAVNAAAHAAGIAGFAPLGASPLAVAGGAAALPGVSALPTGGRLPGTNVVVGSTGTTSGVKNLLGLGRSLASGLGNNLLGGNQQQTQSQPSLSVSPSSDAGTPLSSSIVPAVSALGLGGLVSGTSQSSSPPPPQPDSTAGQAALPVAASGGPVVETPPLQSSPTAGTRASKTNPSSVLINPVIPNSVFKGSGIIFPSFA